VNKVFIGGSREISRLTDAVQDRLRRIVVKGLPILIGDANGADRAVQRFLKAREYQNVEVFCVAGACRNNLAGWPLRSVRPTSARRDFNFFSEKDRTMAEEADFGLMIWDGKSIGTLLNVFRLAKRRKPAVVYTTGRTRAIEIRTEADFNLLLSRSAEEVKRRAARQIEEEGGRSRDERHAGLF
jgi:hypothetical protein